MIIGSESIFPALIIQLISIHITNTMNIREMVEKAGAPFENHWITTEDGYILNVHRLPQLNSNESQVMFLMHGLIAASSMFVLYPEKRSAAFFFHAHGYDVWMGNARGNFFSRNHTSLSPEEAEFWNYTWHEIGYYDLPAMIDYVLEKTGRSELHYIGHSQGVTSVFVLLSEKPEYNAKIKILHAMAPPVIMKYNNKKLVGLIQKRREIENWLKRKRYYEILNSQDSTKMMDFINEFCTFPVMRSICRSFFETSIGAISPFSYHKRIMFDYSKGMFCGSSYKQFLHYAQIIASGRFQKYNHGLDENRRVYNKSQPPQYNLSNIRTKLHILYGTHDLLVLQENIPILLEKVKHTTIAVNKMNLFNHLDFAFGRQVQTIQKLILNVTSKNVECIECPAYAEIK